MLDLWRKKKYFWKWPTVPWGKQFKYKNKAGICAPGIWLLKSWLIARRWYESQLKQYLDPCWVEVICEKKTNYSDKSCHLLSPIRVLQGWKKVVALADLLFLASYWKCCPQLPLQITDVSLVHWSKHTLVSPLQKTLWCHAPFSSLLHFWITFWHLYGDWCQVLLQDIGSLVGWIMCVYH